MLDHARLRAHLGVAILTVILAAQAAGPVARAGSPLTNPPPSPSPSPGPSGGAQGPAPAGGPLGPNVGGPPTTQVPLPYGATGYKYSVVAHGGAPPGWEQPAYNDSTWATGNASFGTGTGQCPIENAQSGDPIHTAWAINTDVLLRKTISVDPTQNYIVGVVIDNDVQVFWNGHALSNAPLDHQNCATFDSFEFAVPASYSGNLTSIVLAVHGIDDNNGPDIADVTVRLASVGPSAPARQASCSQDAQETFGPSCQAEPVNTFTGAYTNAVTDLRLPGRGIGVDFARHYSSINATVGELGPGWSEPYEQHLTFNPGGSITYADALGNSVPFLSDGNGGTYPAEGVTSTLSPVTGGGYQVQRPDLVKDVFNATGQLTSEVDRNGHTITFNYTSGQLTSIVDTVGRTITLGYTGALLTSLTDPLTHQVLYTYDANGRLWKVQDLNGGLTTYAYDANGRLASILDQNSHYVVRNTYGADGRVSQQLDALGNPTAFAWNATTLTSTMTDARNGVWTDVYNADGTLASRSDPLGHTTSYTYDANLDIATVTDPRGNVTTKLWDSHSHLYKNIAPAPFNYTTTYEYDQFGNLHGATDGRGYTTWRYYDVNNNLYQIQLPLAGSPVINFAYDVGATWQLTSTTDARGKTTTFGYDSQGNLNRITTPLGFITTMTYDADRRMLTRVDPRGNVTGGNPSQYTTTYTYDKVGHRLVTTDPLGHPTNNVYDPAGNLLSVTDANNHATSYGYDAANHLQTVTDARSKVTTYGYDVVGNLTLRTDANTHQTTYGYDLAHRLTSVTLPLNRLWTYGYDSVGNLTQVVDAIGNAGPPGSGTTTYTYDQLNRLATITYSDGTPSVSYGYDADSNRTSMVDTATTSYTYDVLDRLSTVDRGTLAHVSYGYDNAGNVTSRNVGQDGIYDVYGYDDDGRMTTLTVLSGQQQTTFGYDAAGNLITKTFPSGNGYVESRTYDRAGALTEVKATKHSSTIGQATYTLDPVGNPLTIVSTSGTTTLSYDEDNRLLQACDTTSCTGPGDNFRRYTYDDVGNRLTEVTVNGTTSYTYDAADELTSTSGPGATSYTYNLDGQETAAGSRTFGYDLAGRLTSTTAGGTTYTYGYDGDGNRVTATTGGSVTAFVWDVNRPVPTLVEEFDGSTKLRKYDYAQGLISMQVSGSPYFFHPNGLGSVLNLTSSSGKTEWTYTYHPYGASRSTTQDDRGAPANLIQFTGQYLDPTGFYHLVARQYDPTPGRLLSADPLAPPIRDPYAARYIYVADNPVRSADPSGLATGAACVNFNAGFGVWQVVFQVCVAVSSSGQGGVTVTVGGGGGANLDVSAGAGIQVSNANNLSDLGGPFGNVSGSGEVGVGLSGDVFGGVGTCPGTIVNGANVAVTVGGGASVAAGGTRTFVFQVSGPSDQPCSSGHSQK